MKKFVIWILTRIVLVLSKILLKIIAPQTILPADIPKKALINLIIDHYVDKTPETNFPQIPELEALLVELKSNTQLTPDVVQKALRKMPPISPANFRTTQAQHYSPQLEAVLESISAGMHYSSLPLSEMAKWPDSMLASLLVQVPDIENTVAWRTILKTSNRQPHEIRRLISVDVYPEEEQNELHQKNICCLTARVNNVLVHVFGGPTYNGEGFKDNFIKECSFIGIAPEYIEVISIEFVSIDDVKVIGQGVISIPLKNDLVFNHVQHLSQVYGKAVNQ